MKHGRIISIKHPSLLNFRNCLRSVMIEAILDAELNISNKIKKLDYFESELQHLSLSDEEKIQCLLKERRKLERILRDSLCICGYCLTTKKDMVYHEIWKEWWCVECFEREKEELNPESFFNNGVIVVSHETKPCWILDWCPYGGIVEDFLRRIPPDDYTCRVFDHDCPVYYVSEKFTENSAQIPSKNTKLKGMLQNCNLFNTEKPVVFDIEKPCHKLNFCPYGSLNDEFFKRESNYKYGCNILPHDCPAFFHTRKIREKPYF